MKLYILLNYYNMRSLLISSAIIAAFISPVVYCKPTTDEFSYTHQLLAENDLLQEASEVVKAQQAPINILSWDEAYAKAKPLVQAMSLEQKVNITTGVGWMTGPCVGNSGRTTNPDFPELCLQDAPLGVRFADGVSSGVAGVNAAASFDREAIRERGRYMGAEFRAKGAHAQLGPSMNMMRAPESGRSWEAFGEDPYLVGVAAAETIHGIQSQGVVCLYQELDHCASNNANRFVEYRWQSPNI
jgi:hypothetical protein